MHRDENSKCLQSNMDNSLTTMNKRQIRFIVINIINQRELKEWGFISENQLILVA